MKNKMLWIGSVLILILSIICFVVFGVGTELIRVFTGSGNGVSFGKYNGKDILLAPQTDFARAVNSFTANIQQQRPELKKEDYFEIYSYAFNAVVQSRAYKDAVKESGYKPSEKLIAQEMLPFFLSPDGKFDPSLSSQIPKERKEELKEEIETMLTWKRFSNDVFGGEKEFGDYIACLSNYQMAFYFNTTEKLGDYTLYGIKSSENESAFLASLGEEKRAFDAVAFDKSSYPEEEVRKFAAENSDLFDTFSLSVITVQEESQAKKLHAQITNNEITFEDGITTYSEKYFSDGYGVVEQNFAYQIKDTLENADDFTKITSLEKDAISEVIKTTRGYSIYKCTNPKTKTDISLPQTFDAVKSYIATNKQELVTDYFTEKAKIFIANAKTEGFEESAKNSGIEVLSIPAFPLNYGNISLMSTLDSSNAAPFLSASTNEDFLEKAFSMNKNEISSPLTIGNYITVLKLTDIQNTKASEEEQSEFLTKVSDYDKNNAILAIISNKEKVENNVFGAYMKINP